MKKLIVLISAVCMMAGSAHAGCGKKVTNTGTLTKYDAAKKTIVVKEGDKMVSLRLTPQSKVDGIKGMLNKKVTVTSEHKKVDSVKPAAS